jgi:hypothetical protein
MAGGYKKIDGKVDGKQFSSTYQPKKNGRPKSIKKIINELLDDSDGILVFSPEQCKILPDGSVQVKIPTTDKLVMVLVKLAMKGDLRAIEILLDRRDGKPSQSVQVIEPNIDPFFFDTMEVEEVKPKNIEGEIDRKTE